MRTTAEYQDIIDRLLIRSDIRSKIRPEPDRISAQLREAADAIDELLRYVHKLQGTPNVLQNGP